MHGKNPLLGVWSVFGTYVLLTLIAVKLGAVGTVLEGMGQLLTGSVYQLTQGKTTFLMMVPTIIAVVVLELPCTIGAGIFQGVLLGKTSKHSVSEFFKNMTEGNHFFKFFVLVLAEELFARGLFLGLLPQIPALSGTFAFYVLFLLGNGIWALVHLSNFKNPEDRHWMRTLPQFVAGIFFTYIFVKYGLLAAVLAHFASNAILFAFHKIQRVDGVDALLMIYTGVCAAVSYLLMEKPLTDALPWLANEPVFELPGWGFWDYVKISVFIPSCFGLVFGFLLYDRGEVKKDKKSLGPFGYAVAIPLVLAIMFGLYAFLGLFISNVPYRILVLAILFAFLQQGASGSAVARTFWAGLPNVYITMCVLQALGFWASAGWLLVNALISAPREVLNKYDD
ncbi:MAG TPA: CPBP family intramembrane glutamic endopeptidase [Candidatus Paceibacterota bacterium]|nr:CPBP family intramembrane glutamic endopeptidase [Candidatus Paceibacterota bacterium]